MRASRKHPNVPAVMFRTAGYKGPRGPLCWSFACTRCGDPPNVEQFWVRGDKRGEARRVASGRHSGSLKNQAGNALEIVTPDPPTRATLAARLSLSHAASSALLEASVAKVAISPNRECPPQGAQVASVIRHDLASVFVNHVCDAPIQIQEPLIRCGRCRSAWCGSEAL